MVTKQLTKKERRTNRVLTIIAWIFILIGVVSVLWFYFFSSSHVSTNNAQVRQYITPVSSKVSGFIKEIHFEENQFVHQGDTLLIIDNREYKNQIDMASANLESTTETVETFERSVDTKASDIHVIDAKIEAAKIEVWRSEQEYNRFKNLVEQNAATLQQFEDVDAHFKQSKANLNALVQQKGTIQVATTAEQTKVAPAKSKILQSKAQLENAKLNYSYTYIVAPYDGWVGTKNIQVGQLVKEGQALVQVVSKQKWVVANFKETQLGKIDIEKDIEIVADAYPNVTFFGKVESLSPAAGSEFSLIKPDNATGNFVKIEQRFPVKIILKDSEDLAKLRTGMNVQVAAKKLD